jgi:hypothetical protein
MPSWNWWPSWTPWENTSMSLGLASLPKKINNQVNIWITLWSTTVEKGWVKNIRFSWETDLVYHSVTFVLSFVCKWSNMCLAYKTASYQFQIVSAICRTLEGSIICFLACIREGAYIVSDVSFVGGMSLSCV